MAAQDQARRDIHKEWIEREKARMDKVQPETSQVSQAHTDNVIPIISNPGLDFIRTLATINTTNIMGIKRTPRSKLRPSSCNDSVGMGRTRPLRSRSPRPAPVPVEMVTRTRPTRISSLWFTTTTTVREVKEESPKSLKKRKRDCAHGRGDQCRIGKRRENDKGFCIETIH